MSSIMMYGTVMIATLVSKVAAFPALYDSEATGCEIPAMGFSGHGAPEVDPLVTVMITQDGTAVMEFVAGEMYDIETPAYNEDSVNAWIHASAGEMLPADPATHFQASSCPLAAHSGETPAATHTFVWTAPATTDTVTISIAQAAASSDYYHTATTDLPGGGAATPAAATPAAAPAAAPPGITAPVLPAAGATDDPVEAEEGDEEEEGTETSASVAAATGTLAAAAAAIAALAM